MKDEYKKCPDFSDVKVGEVFKSFKCLLIKVGVEPLEGGARKKQIKTIERFCSYSKNKQEVTILEIYKEPKEETDRRKDGGRNKYSTHINKLIMHYLCSFKLDKTDFKGDLYCTKKELIENIFLNGESILNDDVSKHSPVASNHIQGDQIDLFKQELISKLYEVLKSSINSLIRKAEIELFNKVYIIKDGKNRPATEEEMLIIENNMQLAKAELNIKREYNLSLEKYSNLYEVLNNKIQLTESWTVKKRTYHIKTSKSIKELLENIMDEEQVFSSMNIINSILIDYILNKSSDAYIEDERKLDAFSQETNIKRTNPKIRFYPDLLTYPEKRLPRNYLRKQEVLCSVFLGKGTY